MHWLNDAHYISNNPTVHYLILTVDTHVVIPYTAGNGFASGSPSSLKLHHNDQYGSDV